MEFDNNKDNYECLNYSYQFLLDEIYDTLENNTNILLNDTNLKITKPDIYYCITKKSIWRNFKINCEQINRSMNQLQNFIEKEFSVKTSINKNGQLLIKGKYNLSMIGNSFKKYIKNYLQCNTCKSIKTTIEKNNTTRLNYLICNNCNTTRAIVFTK